jgi:hypothetical protein
MSIINATLLRQLVYPASAHALAATSAVVDAAAVAAGGGVADVVAESDDEHLATRISTARVSADRSGTPGFPSEMVTATSASSWV